MTRKSTYERSGLTNRPEYRIWAGIVQRCTNPNNPNFRLYGGAGIGLFGPWRESYAAFFDHIGPRPTPKHSVDRIRNERGYEPGNVRWSTAREQGANIKKNVFVEADGRNLCLQEWARQSNISVITIWSRINELGWSPEAAVMTPTKGRKRNSAKLTEAQVCEARRRAGAGETGKNLAAEFSVNHSTMCRAISGRTHRAIAELE